MQRDLVLKAQDGDADAYAQLTSGMTVTLYRSAWLILRDEDRAADALQDALLRAWVDLKSLREPDKFEQWVYRILVRTCYATANKQRRRSRAEQSVSVEREYSATDDQRAVAIRDQLDRAFSRLSTDHKTVIVLVHYAGLSLNEAAAVIGVPLGTVQSRLSRAMQAMRSAIEADDRSSSAVQVTTR